MKDHIVKLFDGELSNLHCLVLAMAGLTITQLDRVLTALEDGETDFIHEMYVYDLEIDRYEKEIDGEVFNILARRSPVANDLRRMIAISKINVDLQRIGDETIKTGRMVSALFAGNNSDPNPQLLRDVLKIGHLAKRMLVDSVKSFDSADLQHTFELIRRHEHCGEHFEDGIRRQLTFVLQDARLIGRTLDIVQIMKGFERCAEYAINIAEFTIFLVEGKDIRHQHLFTP
ncbi:MAG: phosphate signaling complex protein PhoU [Methylococcales bacterium]|nr:phosphate signaling complex protein PhoU [Methylococcales bacterium]